jgi:hypothetical protein
MGAMEESPMRSLPGVVVAVAMALTAAAGARAGDFGRCHARQGLAIPHAAVETVVVVDNTTQLTGAQQRQGSFFVTGKLQAGSGVALYRFGSGPDTAGVQRVGTYFAPALVEDKWRVSSDRQEKTNACISGEVLPEALADLRRGIGEALAGYRWSKTAESALLHHLRVLAAAHPGARQFIVISNGELHVKGRTPATVYESVAGVTTIRQFDPVSEAQVWLKRVPLKFEKGTVVHLFPVGQAEPDADGKVTHPRLADDATRVSDLWLAILTAAGARAVLTPFVPAD